MVIHLAKPLKRDNPLVSLDINTGDFLHIEEGKRDISSHHLTKI